MEIQFDTTLDDLAEHHHRLLRLGTTYKKNRWVGVAGSFLGVGAVFLILQYLVGAELPVWLPLMLGGAGATVYLVFYPEITRRSIKKYLRKRYGDGLPCTTTYTVRNGRIQVNSVNKNASFGISELISIGEDERHIELTFGPKELWVIPKRAFESEEEIDRLKAELSPP